MSWENYVNYSHLAAFVRKVLWNRPLVSIYRTVLLLSQEDQIQIFELKRLGEENRLLPCLHFLLLFTSHT